MHTVEEREDVWTCGITTFYEDLKERVVDKMLNARTRYDLVRWFKLKLYIEHRANRPIKGRPDTQFRCV
jgi:hypothetical protein